MEISHYSWKTAGKNRRTDKSFRAYEFDDTAIRHSVLWQRQRNGNSLVEQIKIKPFSQVNYRVKGSQLSIMTDIVGARRRRHPSSGNRTSFRLICCGVTAAAIRGE
jgi:hypothetical protein